MTKPVFIFSLAAIMLLAGCASTVERSHTPIAAAQQQSSDRFWQHINEAGTQQDWFHLLSDGAQAMEWRLRMIDSAHQAIDMETFLWKPDRGGAMVLSHLLAAADRGVQVRLLIDDSFTPYEDRLLTSIDSHPNIQLRIYNPYRNRYGGMTGRTLFNLNDFQRVNHRLHNKTLVIDGWAANVGGRNLADEYFGLHDAHNFRDMEVLAMGGGVAAASEHFAAFWNSGWAFPVKDVIEVEVEQSALESLRKSLEARVGSPQVAPESELEQAWETLARSAVSGRAYFVADRPAQESPGAEDSSPVQLADYIVDIIDSAEHEVILVTAYLVPTQELSAVIKRSVERGIRVRILTNSLRSNNHIAAHAAYIGYVEDLVGSGVELYELRADAEDRNLYMETPVDSKALGLHAKFMLLDTDRVFIGSSNLDPRSLKLNTEVGMMVESDELNQRLRDNIAVDFLPRNAWSVQLDEDQQLVWIGGDERFDHPPADSVFQQLEDWFIGLLPIDSNM